MDKRKEIPHFPDGIIFEILVRVPAKDLISFKLVCKPWCSIISSKNFINAHLTRITRAPPPEIILPIRRGLTHGDPAEIFSINLQDSSLLAENLVKEVKFVGNSCNGLILICNPLSVCNPITRQFERFPLPQYDHDPSYFQFERFPPPQNYHDASYFNFALVHDNTIDKYKIFGMHDVWRQYFVLTLGNASSEWRELVSIKEHIPDPAPIVYLPFLFVETELHWVAVDVFEVEVYVFSVDVANENITNITKSPKPEGLLDLTCATYHLSEVKGFLCLTLLQHYYLESWVLKEKTWTKVYSISVGSLPNKPSFFDTFFSRNICVVCIPRSDTGNVLDVLKIFIHHEDQLFLYQLKNGDLKQIGLVRGASLLYNLCFHYNSLVTWE